MWLFAEIEKYKLVKEGSLEVYIHNIGQGQLCKLTITLLTFTSLSMNNFNNCICSTIIHISYNLPK